MPRSAIPSLWENFGLNVGNHILNGGLQVIDGVQSDVDYHASIGLGYIRTSLRPFTNSTSEYAQQQQALLKTMIQMYIAAGIEVQLIIQYGGGWSPANEDNPGFLDYLEEHAAWAESVGVTRIQHCNELESSGGHLGDVTRTQIYDFLQTLPAIADGAGFTGEHTYSAVINQTSEWDARGLGNFDDLGVDGYGSIASVDSQCKALKAIHGDNVYLSEWSVTNSGIIWDFNKQDPVVLKNWIMGLYQNVKINFPNHVNYYFTWKNANDGPKDALACARLNSGELRLFWYSLINQRSPVIW